MVLHKTGIHYNLFISLFVAVGEKMAYFNTFMPYFPVIGENASHYCFLVQILTVLYFILSLLYLLVCFLSLIHAAFHFDRM